MRKRKQMPIKLTRIKEKRPKNQYMVVVEVMHGDADKDELIELECDNEAHFMKMMSAMDCKPLCGAEGGDEEEYGNWCDEYFGEETIPRDCTCDGQVLSDVRYVDGFYYDKDGVKWEAEVTKEK